MNFTEFSVLDTLNLEIVSFWVQDVAISIWSPTRWTWARPTQLACRSHHRPHGQPTSSAAFSVPVFSPKKPMAGSQYSQNFHGVWQTIVYLKQERDQSFGLIAGLFHFPPNFRKEKKKTRICKFYASIFSPSSRCYLCSLILAIERERKSKIKEGRGRGLIRSISLLSFFLCLLI